MVEAINGGKLDIIATCRPSIADPFLPQKIDEGRLDDIRECIGCNVCISRWEIGGPPLICTQNATAGRGVPARLAPGEVRAGEERRQRRARRRRRPGRDGVRDDPRQARHAPRAPGRGAGRHGREHALDPAAPRSRRVGPRRQLPQDPDRQAEERRVHPEHDARREGREGVRRGDRDRRDRLLRGRRDGLNGCTHEPIPGADASKPYVLTPEQLMDEGKQVPGTRVVVVDDDGYFMGVSIAEKLALDGKQVTLMTHLGHDRALHALHARGAEHAPEAPQLGVEIVDLPPPDLDRGGPRQGRCTSSTRTGTSTTGRPTPSCSSPSAARTRRSSARSRTRSASTRSGPRASPGSTGSATARRPRLIADAVFSGHRLAREIDSDNPAMPLPFKRERKVDRQGAGRGLTAPAASGGGGAAPPPVTA